MLCKTKSDAEKVLEIANGMGYPWIKHDIFINDILWDNSPDICYDLHNGEYSHASYYRKKGYSIISAPSFISLYMEINYTLVPFGSVYEDPGRKLTVIVKNEKKLPGKDGKYTYLITFEAHNRLGLCQMYKKVIRSQFAPIDFLKVKLPFLENGDFHTICLYEIK